MPRSPDPLFSVGQEHPLLTRSGAGAPELQRCANRPRIPTIAGDRPPRYGRRNARAFTKKRPHSQTKNATPYRRARACPSPSFMHQIPSLFPSVGQDRLILTRLRSGDRKLQIGANRPRALTIAGDRPPRYGEKNAPAFTKKRPRSRKKTPPPPEGEGLSLAIVPCARPPPLCRSRVPALDPFAIRRSQTTDRGESFA